MNLPPFWLECWSRLIWSGAQSVSMLCLGIAAIILVVRFTNPAKSREE